ncbi:hypothetical protein SAMN05421820_11766 [Pedobacter steynii]|uniref:Uncharacterized protein n=1 Tax=Pedobacter steynii TaxID=430522 RepID=A0A1H0L797_9SPHI|nr:hypothetical protein [Pedobacter steynii]NQX43429.1 hypothetical protein [Pedobacter steynii]SDO63831.1 hypothetical protein SAMN05421820_11766 [Pedobacter steynii]
MFLQPGFKIPNHTKVPVYVCNCTETDEDYLGISERFSNLNEFLLQAVDGEEQINQELRLLQSLKNAVNCAKNADQKFMVVCNTSHYFTKEYSFEAFIDHIREGELSLADFLTGGLRWFNSAFQVTDNLYWIDSFSGVHFLVIYQRSYQKILEVMLNGDQDVHTVLSSVSQNKLMIHPFVSVQEDVPVALMDHIVDSAVAKVFFNANQLLHTLNDIAVFYREHQAIADLSTLQEQIVIPTYIINLSERPERLAHIKQQFKDRKEFMTTIVEACVHEIGAVGLWKSIRKIIKIAIENDDDVIVICEDDHEFTPQYTRDYFLKNVLEAYSQGTDYLNGGIAAFENCVLVGQNRFWTDRPTCTQFIVIYGSFFQKILDAPYDDTVLADAMLANLTANKIALHPFISTQRDFGYSDITALFDNNKGTVGRMFSDCDRKFSRIRAAYHRYHKSNAMN